MEPARWEHWWACRWDCQSNVYPERTGDRRTVVKPSDFYSARQWHSTGMYCDYHRPHGIEHELQLCLPEPAGLSAGPGRNIRLYLYRGPDCPTRSRVANSSMWMRPMPYSPELVVSVGR